MTKSAADVEQEVMASRGQLDRTVDALKEKMTPGQLFDEATHAMGGAGEKILSKFMDQAKENPMPLAVMGLGLAWLMMGSQKQTTPGAGYARGPTSGYPTGATDTNGLGGANGLGDKIHGLGDKASDLVSGARDKLAGVASSATEAGQSAAHTLAATAGSAAEKAGEYGKRAQQTIMDMFEREPLLTGAIAVVVGVAIGAALPSTSTEDEMVGPMRDRLLEKGKGIAHDTLEQAGEAAHSAYDAVKSELQSADAASDLPSKVQQATTAGVQAAKEAMQKG